jgi:hypothetical protein
MMNATPQVSKGERGLTYLLVGIVWSCLILGSLGLCMLATLEAINTFQNDTIFSCIYASISIIALYNCVYVAIHTKQLFCNLFDKE